MTQITQDEIHAGQAIYNSIMLKIYNFWVLSISNSWIWRCPTSKQLAQYQKYRTNNHLDIGVGTGYYLKHTHWPENTKLVLMDLNPTCLETARKTIVRLSPEVYRADIFKCPQQNFQGQFTSISMNYLLHCLPGTMNDKAVAIANATTMLKPGGILFGATILSDDHLQTNISKQLAGFYNQKHIFSNQCDDHQSLRHALNQNLDAVELNIVGCVALFKGQKSN